MKKETKKILQAVQSTICNDLMTWDELADKVLELEAEIERLKLIIKHGVVPQDLKNDISYPDER